MSAPEFEDFTERLLNAHKFAAPPLLRTLQVHRQGRPGDKQFGVDFEGALSDGRRASWQCKRYARFTPAQAREAVAANTRTADVHHLVLSCEASTGVRTEMEKHPGWVLVDKRGLQQLLEDLPRHKRREVLEATFGPHVRRRLMESPGQDLFVSLATFADDRDSPHTLLNDLGTFAGREAELKALVDALDRTTSWPMVVLVTGPGGRGKTRLLMEGLRRVEARRPEVPVLLLSADMVFHQEAVDDLPGGPAVVVVDDAHRDPSQLGALVAYARQTPGTQLVLASQPSQLSAVRRQLHSRGAPTDYREIEVGELSRREARALVEDLATGLDLPFGLREHLATQALHSPHIAVLTVNLIRRGELTAPLAIDAGLREGVMARYVDITTGPVAGAAPEQINALLAVYSALKGTAAEISDTEAAIESILGLTHDRHLRLLEALQDRGVLVIQEGLTRVVPDILGDDALERASVAAGRDTGFVEKLWQQLGPIVGARLVVSLAELDWRISHRVGGGPRVLAGIWADLREGFLHDSLDDVHVRLSTLGGLTQTQPTAFFYALEALRDRLSRPPTTSDTTAGQPDAETPTERARARGVRRLLGWAPTQPEDLRRVLAPLYAQCAANESALLERALDALWDLRRTDLRPPHQHQQHPERALVDVLASLDHLPDPTFPDRIVTKVEHWLLHDDQGEGDATPLFALKPLIAKQGITTRQTDVRTLEWGGYVVAADWARPVRDRVRGVLQEQASSQGLRRAGQAVALLGDMLQQLQPSAGLSITEGTHRTWEDDDLATLAALTAVSAVTTSGAIRRLIRDQVSWVAEHARDSRLRHEALCLATSLDQRTEDDVVRALLPLWRMTLPDQRGQVVPPLNDYRNYVAARRSGEERDREQPSTPSSPLEHLGRAQNLLLVRATDALATAPLTDALRLIEQIALEMAQVTPDTTPQIGRLYAHLVADGTYPAADVARAVAARAPGPLDSGLTNLLGHWANQDPASLLMWLDGRSQHRPEVRKAVGRTYEQYVWAERGTAFAAVFDRGSVDPDAEVRDAFLVSSFSRFAGSPGRAAQHLLEADAAPWACELALHLGCGNDIEAWGSELSVDDARLVLEVINKAGWGDWTLQHIAAGIATRHPTLVLEHLTAHAPQWQWDDVEGLPTALESRSEDFAAWLLTRAVLDDDSSVPVIHASTGGRLGAETSAELQRLTDSMDQAALLGLARLLEQVPSWPAQRPDLARALVLRARHLGGQSLVSLLNSISRGLRPTGPVSFLNGVSEELQTAQSLAATQSAREHDPDLRRTYEGAALKLSEEIARESRRHDDDYD